MSAQTFPALVGIAHGTSSPAGQAMVEALMRAVAEASPERTVALGFVDVQHPDAPETLSALPGRMPAVVVPLLLSAGYHVHVDLTEAVDAVTDRAVTLAGALGPDGRLVELLRQRLDETGLAPDDVLVLAVAGSSDARAVADCRDVAGRLAGATAHDVTLGFLSAAEPRLADAVSAARAENPGKRILVSSYLLAPGYFQGLVEGAGATRVTAPLLAEGAAVPGQLVDVVLDRYHSAE